MTDITIPPKVVKAHAEALLTHETWGHRSWDELSDDERGERLEGSEVACLAMLKSWPDMVHLIGQEDEHNTLLLPLQEPSNDK
jgi:hypothetical protein